VAIQERNLDPSVVDVAGAAGAAAAAVGVTKIFGSGEAAVVALDDVSIGFEQGRFTAIMGPSGSGKSTLLQCIAGLDEVTSGRVFIGDTDVTGLNEKGRTKLRRDDIGFVFQSFNLIPTLTAAENISLPSTLAGRRDDEAWTERAISTLGIGDRMSHRPSELSGGQQQRVAIARAMSGRPKVVFADEPTGALDSKRGAELLDFMRRAVDQFGQTIVMVTHDPIAASKADRVVFLADGHIADVMEGPTVDKILDRMRALEG
jgi:putative ABC transport system ATP-binding protein